MEKMEETIPHLGAHSPQASSLQPLTMPGVWDSAAFQGLLRGNTMKWPVDRHRTGRPSGKLRC